MCGIAVLLSSHPRGDLAEKAVAMTQPIRHRGPDDEGYAVFAAATSTRVFGGDDTPADVLSSGLSYAPDDRRVPECPRAVAAMGHRRLSIVDLSATGHQPLCSEDGRHWIVFNGEVYNHVELRRELEASGREFVSTSDTEVVLQAYLAWGQDCLHRFNGMFSFVIYDREERSAFAARDRFGIKPLYFAQAADGLVAIASEPKQLLTLFEPRLNGQRAYDFLLWDFTDHTSETLFRDVFQLRGGEFLIWGDGRVSRQRWYRLPTRSFTGSFQEAADEFQRLLEDSVRLRLRADVDVGSCLSGGLDSSSIVCLANRLLRVSDAEDRQKTFSACSTVEVVDERPFIDIVVERTGVDAHYVYPRLEQLLETSREISRFQDEPYGSTSIYAQWMVFQLTRENGVKVTLDGQGADEQLAGYSPYFAYRAIDLFRQRRWASLAVDVAAAVRTHGVSHFAGHFLNQLALPRLEQRVRLLAGLDAPGPVWLDLDRLQADRVLPFDISPFATVEQRCRHQLLDSSLPKLLRFADRNSMAHSVESRTPFLDYRLVEHVSSLPGDFRIARGVTKRVLRAAMRGVLPEEIRCRMDKIGFATPEQHWVQQQDPSLFREMARRAVDCSSGILNPCVLDSVEKIIAGRRPFDHSLWRVISLGQWMDMFSVGV